MTDDATQTTETHSYMYAELSAVGPYGADLGHALITMVEPHLGRESRISTERDRLILAGQAWFRSR